MHIPCLDLKVLLLHVRERVRGVHGERELEVGLPALEDLHEGCELIRPNRASKDLDEEPLFEERVAEIRALFDVARCLLSKFLQAVLEHSPVESDVDPALDVPQPGRRLVRGAKDEVIDNTYWTITIIMSFISTYSATTRRSFSCRVLSSAYTALNAKTATARGGDSQ